MKLGVIASEWVKLRSMRSMRVTFIIMVVIVLLSGYLTWRGVRAWDALQPAQRAAFQLPSVERMVLPVLQMCAAVLGALVITSEYVGGMIRTSLTAVPGRLALLSAKVIVVAAVTAIVGMAALGAVYALNRVAIGQRPSLSNEVVRMFHNVPVLVGTVLLLVAISLIALGLGVALRSSVGALTSIVVLLFLLPVVVDYFPEPWSSRIAAVLPSNLPSEIAGYPTSSTFLQPSMALILLVGYVVVALGVGATVMVRTDQ